jgi:hypothetical protein
VLHAEKILAVLNHHRVEYVVIGGFAAQLHGATRPTDDIDVTPRTTTENLDRLAAALRELGALIRTETVDGGLPFSVTGESLTGIRTLNLITPHGEMDLTFTPSGTEGFDDLNRAATLHNVGTVQVRLASLADIIRSKTAAGRPKDNIALPELHRLAHRQDPNTTGPGPNISASYPQPLTALPAHDVVAQARAAAAAYRASQNPNTEKPPTQGPTR